MDGECIALHHGRAEGGATETEETPEPALALAPEPPSRTAPFALLASGSALLITGITWDVANLVSIREFNDVNDACADGSCDPSRQEELTDRLDGAKMPIAVLFGPTPVWVWAAGFTAFNCAPIGSFRASRVGTGWPSLLASRATRLESCHD